MKTYEEIQKLIDDITRPMVDKLIEFNYKQNLPIWLEQYKIIKDESWPECSNYNDFNTLPENIKKECREQHRFSPDIWKQSIIDDAKAMHRVEPNALHYKFVNNNLEFIVNKNVIDFCCRYGNYSFSCLAAGAKHVTGFDIRDSSLTIANALIEYHNISSDKVKFIKLDIHNYSELTELCRNNDTALINGIMYHVHDHYQILSAVARSEISTIIIETGENSNIADSPDPMVWWKTEPTFDDLAGWLDGQDTIPVGYPNLAWFKMVMSNLGYNYSSTCRNTSSQSQNNSEKFMQIRSTHVFQKNKIS